MTSYHLEELSHQDSKRTKETYLDNTIHDMCMDSDRDIHDPLIITKTQPTPNVYNHALIFMHFCPCPKI